MAYKSSTKQNEGQQGWEEPRELPMRYLNFGIYFLAALVNSLPVHTFSSINTLIEQKFHVDSAIVTLNALIFTIIHPICAYPCNLILEKYGMRIGFVIGGGLLVGGVWLRTLIAVGQQWCLIGSSSAAIGNIFVLNSASKVASNWFKVESIPNMVFLAVLANLISVTLGASIPGLLLGQQSTIDEIVHFLIIEAVVVSGPLLLLVIFFRDKPKIPPSYAQQVAAHVKRKDYKLQMKQLFSNKQYIKLLFGMALNYGTLTALIATLDQLLKGLGYSSPGEITSVTILSAMLIGILGNPVFSMFLKKTKAYKAVATFTTLGGFVTVILLQFLFYENVSQLMYIIIYAGFAGFFLIPVPAIFIAYAAEETFPMDEGSSTGYLFAASQTFGFCMGMMVTLILDERRLTTYIAFSIYSLFLGLSVIFVLSTKEKLLRLRAEKIGKKSHLSQIHQIHDSLIISHPSAKVGQ